MWEFGVKGAEKKDLVPGTCFGSPNCPLVDQKKYPERGPFGHKFGKVVLDKNFYTISNSSKNLPAASAQAAQANIERLQQSLQNAGVSGTVGDVPEAPETGLPDIIDL